MQVLHSEIFFPVQCAKGVKSGKQVSGALHISIPIVHAHNTARMKRKKSTSFCRCSQLQNWNSGIVYIDSRKIRVTDA